MSYFEHLPAIRYEGRESDNPFAYRHYDRNKLVLGKTHGRTSAPCRLLLAYVRLAGRRHVRRRARSSVRGSRPATRWNWRI